MLLSCNAVHHFAQHVVHHCHPEVPAPLASIHMNTLEPHHRGSRTLIPHALPPEMCRELSCIHNSLAVIGYRPCVRSLTLHELLVTQPELLPMVAAARQLVLDAVEDHFDLTCSVWPETTSLIGWTSGASIGWHHDSNRPYLAARHFSAVAYLNTQGKDFQGGTFCFQSGVPPLRVPPAAGSLLLYTADDSNIHSVEPVTGGQRLTLTMWFTLDPEHQEDTKVLSQLGPFASGCTSTSLPSTMYIQSDGLDIRLVQLQQLLGVTIKRCMCPTCKGSTSEADGSTANERPPGGDGQPPQESDSELQACCAVECCAHAGAATSNVVAAQGSTGTPHQAHFSSVQAAVLALHLFSWRQEGPCCCDHQQGQAAGEARACCKCERSSGCCVVQQAPAAAQLLQDYLQSAACKLEQVLPKWRELGALVPCNPD